MTTFDGDLVWLPPTLRVTVKSDDEIVVGPTADSGTAGSEPDILIGQLEFLSRSKAGTLKRGTVDVRPPAPFLEDDVDHMWEAIQDSPVPVPNRHRHQGSGGEGALGARSESALAWMLPSINAACLRMLRSWPQVESVDLVWRPLDVVGGVEDLKVTERQAARYSAISSPKGIPLPGKTARRMHAIKDWKCQTLSQVARELIRRIEAQLDSETWNPSLAIRPLRVVASRSAHHSRIADPPPSSWPKGGRDLYFLLLAALALVTSVPKGKASPPLTDLWRIYEAWISSEVIRSVNSECNIAGVLLGEEEGEKVVIEWSLPRGAKVHVLTQPTIGSERTTLGGVLRRSIYSCAGVLEPDVLIICTPDGSSSRQSLFAIDAKKRGSGGLSDSELAEYGGKYMWNLRQKWGGGERSLDAMLVASPASKSKEGELGHSRIHRTIARPGDSEDHFVRHVRQMVRDGLEGKRGYVRFLAPPKRHRMLPQE